MTDRVSYRAPAAYRTDESASRFRERAADAAILATTAAIASLFLVSAVTLEHFGIAYISSGGGPLSKVHPAFLFALAALGARCLATRHPVQTAWRLATDDAGVVLLLFSVGVTMAFAALVAKVPFTGVLDTFVLPVLLFLLLRDLDVGLRRWLAMLVAAILCLNAVMAVMEFLGHSHFVTLDFDPSVATADPTRSDVRFDWKAEIALDWRPTALFGHPLVNGLIVQSAICCLVARGSRWLPWVWKGPILAMLCVSMGTFGARTSLVLAGALGGYLVLDGWCRAVSRGARLQPRQIAIALVLVAVTGLLILVASDTGVFDRTLERFANDNGSAATRMVMLELFQHASWSDLVLGPDKDVIATWQRLEGLEFGIESSWVGLALTYGFAVTAMLLVGLFAFSRSVVRASGPGAALILLAFYLAVSGSASLSGKTTVLAETTVLVQLFLYPERRRRDARSAAEAPRAAPRRRPLQHGV